MIIIIILVICTSKTHAKTTATRRVGSLFERSVESSAVPPPPHFDPLNWLRDRGGRVGSVVVAQWPQTAHGVGLCATADIARGELLLALPLALCITASQPAAATGLHEGHRLCLQLLCERSRGSSPFVEWLDSLPQSFEAPLHWPEEELEPLLRCPELLARARDERGSLDMMLEDLDAEDAAVYRWAYSTVQSRAFCVRRCGTADSWVLAPCADLFNHADDGPVSISFDDTAGALLFRAARPVAAKDEVTLRYGARDDAALLLQYGFVLNDNPHASAHLPHLPYPPHLPHPPHPPHSPHPAAEVRAEAGAEVDRGGGCGADGGERARLVREAWLESLVPGGVRRLHGGCSSCGGGYEGGDCGKGGGRGGGTAHHVTRAGASPELMAVLRLRHTTAAERSEGAAAAWRLVEGRRVGRANEQRVLREVRDAARARLRLFAPREHDETASAPPPVEPPPPYATAAAPRAARLALADAWAAQQRTVLEAALEATKEQLRQLDAEEVVESPVEERHHRQAGEREAAPAVPVAEPVGRPGRGCSGAPTAKRNKIVNASQSEEI